MPRPTGSAVSPLSPTLSTARSATFDDLHVGGDERLGGVAFLDEPLASPERLEAANGDVEPMVNGDPIGLWEFTQVDCVARVDVPTERYPESFEQHRATETSRPITLVPGNHHDERSADEGYGDRLAEHSVDTGRERSITRPIGDRTIRFEGGHHRDPGGAQSSREGSRRPLPPRKRSPSRSLLTPGREPSAEAPGRTVLTRDGDPNPSIGERGRRHEGTRRTPTQRGS